MEKVWIRDVAGVISNCVIRMRDFKGVEFPENVKFKRVKFIGEGSIHFVGLKKDTFKNCEYGNDSIDDQGTVTKSKQRLYHLQNREAVNPETVVHANPRFHECEFDEQIVFVEIENMQKQRKSVYAIKD